MTNDIQLTLFRDIWHRQLSVICAITTSSNRPYWPPTAHKHKLVLCLWTALHSAWGAIGKSGLQGRWDEWGLHCGTESSLIGPWTGFHVRHLVCSLKGLWSSLVEVKFYKISAKTQVTEFAARVIHIEQIIILNKRHFVWTIYSLIHLTFCNFSLLHCCFDWTYFVFMVIWLHVRVEIILLLLTVGELCHSPLRFN